MTQEGVVKPCLGDLQPPFHTLMAPDEEAGNKTQVLLLSFNCNARRWTARVSRFCAGLPWAGQGGVREGGGSAGQGAVVVEVEH